MTDEDRPFDWVRFLVHFFFGAIFGALVGLYGGAGGSKAQILLAMGLGAVIVGLVAGFFGDRFWHSFRDSLLNPFRWF